MSDDPRRLFESGPDGGDATSDALRAALEAGREERPSEAQLASLAAALGPLVLPPGGGGGGGPPMDPSATVTTSLAAKSIGAVALAAAVTLGVIGGAVVFHHPDEAPPRASEAPRPAPPPQTAPSVPVGVDVPDDLEPPVAPPVAPPVVRAPPRPSVEPPAPTPSFEVNPTAELALIRSAQDALRSSPARALAIGEEHARRFGDGTLVQEREVVVIDALHRLGRDDEARARAARFHERWPRSAHGRRVDVIVGP